MTRSLSRADASAVETRSLMEAQRIMAQQEARMPSPGLEISVEPRLVRITHQGVVLAETTCALRVDEPGRPPRLFTPRCDVASAPLSWSGRTSHCATKGRLAYFSVEVNGVEIEDAGFAVDAPAAGAGRLIGYLAFDATKIDQAGL